MNPFYSENMCLSSFCQQNGDSGHYFQTEIQSFDMSYSLQQCFWTKCIANLWQSWSLATISYPRTNQNEWAWWTSNLCKYSSVFVLLSVKLGVCHSILTVRFDVWINVTAPTEHLQVTIYETAGCLMHVQALTLSHRF